MSEIMLQLNFNFSVSKEEYEQAVSPLADKFANVPGLIWKVWILNEEKSEAGGIYLFENQAALDDYLAGSLAKIVTTHPALSNFSIKQFGIMKDITKVTRGPL
jgi:hypothetical protein